MLRYLRNKGLVKLSRRCGGAYRFQKAGISGKHIIKRTARLTFHKARCFSLLIHAAEIVRRNAPLFVGGGRQGEQGILTGGEVPDLHAASRQHGGLGMILPDVTLDAEGVLHRPQGKKFFHAHAGEAGLGGLGARRKDQLVIGFLKPSPVSRFFTETALRSG